MKLAIFKKKVIVFENEFDLKKPKKLTYFSFLGIIFYESKEFHKDII